MGDRSLPATIENVEDLLVLLAKAKHVPDTLATDNPELCFSQFLKNELGCKPDYRMGAFDPEVMLFPVDIYLNGIPIGRGKSSAFDKARLCASHRCLGNILMLLGYKEWIKAADLEGEHQILDSPMITTLLAPTTSPVTVSSHHETTPTPSETVVSQVPTSAPTHRDPSPLPTQAPSTTEPHQEPSIREPVMTASTSHTIRTFVESQRSSSLRPSSPGADSAISSAASHAPPPHASLSVDDRHGYPPPSYAHPQPQVFAPPPYSSFVPTQAFQPYPVAPTAYGMPPHAYQPAVAQPPYAQPPVAPAPPPRMYEPSPAAAPSSAPAPAQSLMDFLKTQLRPVPSPDHSANPKADLANWCGQVGLVAPIYNATREGPDHKPYYSVVASLLGVVVGNGAGTRKTTAEVDAAANAMRNLQVWVQCLRMEDEKYFRGNAPLKLDCDVERTDLLFLDELDPGANPHEPNCELVAKHLNCHANAFANTSGGLVLVGVTRQRMVMGEALTREDVDAILLMFDHMTQSWSPAPDKKLFSWRVFPVFSKEEIDNGTMISTMEKIFSHRDSRGMVWPPDRRVVLGLSVAKSMQVHQIESVDAIEPVSGDTPRIAYVHTQVGIRLLRAEEFKRATRAT